MRGQAGIEGMVLFTIMMVVVVFTIVTYAYRNAEIDSLKTHLEAEKLCNSARNSINQVMVNGPGSRNQLELPQALFSYSYDMTVHSQDQKIVMAWRNASVVCPILTQNVTNSTHSVFVLGKGNVTVANSGGVVVVS